MKHIPAFFVSGLLILLASCLLPGSALAAEKIVYQCRFTSDTISVDGRFDEPAWDRAPLMSWMVPPKKGKPLSRTISRVLWDDRYLYVAFQAMDRDILGTLTDRDSATCREDVLETFIMPPGPKGIYYNFEINALGTIYDGLNAKGISWRKRKEWNSPGVQCKIIIDGTINDHADRDREWRMELAIPFADLEIPPGSEPSGGQEWLFHLARYDYSRYLPGGRELSSCAPLSKVNFHNPGEWNRLLFVR